MITYLNGFVTCVLRHLSYYQLLIASKKLRYNYRISRQECEL